MTSPNISNVWGWIKMLPPLNKWNNETLSLCIFASETISLNLSVTKRLKSLKPELSFSIVSESHFPLSLWNSTSFYSENSLHQGVKEAVAANLFVDIITGILKYGPRKRSSFRLPEIRNDEEFSYVFNLAFLTLTLLVCIYEAPQDHRMELVQALRQQLASLQSKAAMTLARVLGSNLEERWMKSLNLGITNWILELQASGVNSTAPSPLFSYSLSASNLWKAQLYCPVVAMLIKEPSSQTNDDRLLFSLNYQQVEAVVQLGYEVAFREKWIDLTVYVDNIRCDIVPLVSESMMNKRGYGSEEKHFPSQITLEVTPTIQYDVLSVSVSKSTENPIHEVGIEKGFEGTISPPNSLGLAVSASETITTSLKPWKFEQSVLGNSAILNWLLHDGVNGREISTLKPSKCELLWPKAWFRNRYSTAYRPFTKQGGIIFAKDEYGESVSWKLSEEAEGKVMEFEIKGKIWLTYWPNKKRTFHSETRILEFKEFVVLKIEK